MKRTNLIAILIGLTAIAAVSQDSLARGRTYHPTLGRFVQRDPRGTSLEPSIARNLSSVQFTQRDPIAQYADGMNLYQYVRSAPTARRDPSGLAAIFDFASRTIDEELTETIIIPPGDEGAKPWGGKRAWRSRFTASTLRTGNDCFVDVVVRVRFSKPVDDWAITGWKRVIADKWSKKCRVCCPVTLSGCGWTPITVAMEHSDANADYIVTPQDLTATESGVSGIAGTTSMTAWGERDREDVTHEFGHMLGFKDEFYNVDGKHYPPPRQEGGNVMNNPLGGVSDEQCRRLGSKIGWDCRGEGIRPWQP